MNPSNVALSYVLLLVIVGFFLWILRNFLQAMSKKHSSDEGPERDATVPNRDSPTRALPLSQWQLRISHPDGKTLLSGQLQSINPGGAFLETTATLAPQERILLDMEVPAYGRVRTAAQVLWVGEHPPDAVGAQVRFLDLGPAQCTELFRLAGQRSLLMVSEDEEQPRA